MQALAAVGTWAAANAGTIASVAQAAGSAYQASQQSKAAKEQAKMQAQMQDKALEKQEELAKLNKAPGVPTIDTAAQEESERLRAALRKGKSGVGSTILSGGQQQQGGMMGASMLSGSSRTLGV